MERSTPLGRLQHAVLRVLWQEEEATVARVTEALDEEGLERAPTTVATMLGRLERRGLVEHRADGRQYVYRARVSEAEVARSLLEDVAHRLSRGDVTALVAHLIEENEIEPGELDALEALIRRARREAGDER